MSTLIRCTKIIAGTLLAVVWINVYAHSELESSVPGEGSMLNTPPEKLQLTFSEPVFLLEVNILDAQGEPVNIEFSQPADAAAMFSVSLPVLQAGRFTVEWTAAGEEDDHTILGEYSFMVHSE